jgi:hypothetical protein
VYRLVGDSLLEVEGVRAELMQPRSKFHVDPSIQILK